MALATEDLVVPAMPSKYTKQVELKYRCCSSLRKRHELDGVKVYFFFSIGVMQAEVEGEISLLVFFVDYHLLLLFLLVVDG